MVVTSPKIQVEINTGVFIDKHLSWGAHIQHVNNRVAKN